MKITTVLVARPQFIKASVVSAEFAKYPGVSKVVVACLGTATATRCASRWFDDTMSGSRSFSPQIWRLVNYVWWQRMMGMYEHAV